MLDLVLGALLVALGIRGWMRGLVKEVISLAVLVMGTVAAFRLSTPVGRVIANMSGASPDAARYIAGVVIFLAVAIGAAVVSRVLHLGLRILPGVSTVNRAAGAALSLLAMTLVVTLLMSLASVVTLPEAMADEVEQSAVAGALTDPDGAPQRVLGFLSGDRVVAISLRIRELTGSEAAVPQAGAPVQFPAAEVAELERLPKVEEALLDLLDRERIAADREPLPRSSGLDQVSYDLGLAAYATGELVKLDSEELRSVLNAAGIPTTQRSSLAVLAASPEAAHAALVAESGAVIERDGFTRVGVTVLQGPVGLLVIQILSG